MSPFDNSDKLPPELASEIQGIIDSEPALKQVPGVVIGIVREGELAGVFSHGMAALQSGESPGESSIARVASVTKTFTATAIMQLRDASLLELDDPLLIHIPEFTVAEAKAAPLEGVTIRRLLTHHSGLSTEHPAVDWDAADFPQLEHVMDTLEKIQVVIPQDSQWKYSNLAYCLLGEVIARLSGRPYIDYVQEEIIAPLGLENTAFDLSPEQEALKMAGYSPPKPGESAVRPAPYGHLNGFSSAGQLQTNVEDLAKLISFQLGSGPDSILSLSSRAEMRRPVYIADDWSSGQGLGWRAVRKGERVFWNHGGAVHGFSTSVIFNVPTRTGVIMLANMWPTPLPADFALSIAVKNAGSELPKQAPAPSLSGALGDALKPGEYDGDYWAEPGLSVSIVGTESGIALPPPSGVQSGLHNPASLGAGEEDDTFIVLSGRGAGETAVFERDDAGVVTGFKLGGFRYRKTG